MNDAELVSFLQWALPQLGYRWPGFRKVRGQVRKRLARRLAALGLPDLAALRARLAADPAEWAALDELCRITISRFHRDRGVFERLRAEVLPALRDAARAAGRPVRVWSAGCASGEEPYTLALAWRLEVAPGPDDPPLDVVATDAEPAVLARARRAIYDAGSLRELPPAWRAAAFVETREGLRLRPELREGVRFRRQDIRRAQPRGPFDLVLCRHLALTYFAEPQQRAVLARVAARLRPGGFLVVGTHERPPQGLPFRPVPGVRGIFRRDAPASPATTGQDAGPP